MSEPTNNPKALLGEAYSLLREAEFHLQQRGFTLGTGKDGAFLARSAEFRERVSGEVDLSLRRAVEKAYGPKPKRKRGGR